MTTLADMTLRVIRIVGEVIEGTATAANATSLTDTLSLIQPNEYWARGTLWFLGGGLDGFVTPVLSYASNKLTFATQNPVPAAGQVYAVGRNTYPYWQIVSSINQALQDTYIIEIDATSLTGDGSKLEFSLVDIQKLTKVELVDQSTNPDTRYASTHWREQDGVLIFDQGYAPPKDWKIVLHYKIEHSKLVGPTDAIDSEINIEWLRWKSCEYLLYWGVRAYGDAKEYRIEELLNSVVDKLKGLWPRHPIVRVHTAGG